MNKVFLNIITSLPKIQLKAKSKYGDTITQIRRHCDEGIQAFQALQRPLSPAQVNILDRCKGRRLRGEFLKLVMMVMYGTLHKNKLPLILMMEYGIVVFVPLDCELDCFVDIAEEGNI